MKLLHIDSSASGPCSVSRRLSAAIVARLSQAHSQLQVVCRDLAAMNLAHWTPTHGAGDPSARLDATLLTEFMSADIVVIGAPMYNFTVPSQLKGWIDRIVVEDKTFRYGCQGVEGLAGNKRVIVASSRGGFYGAGTPAAALDFQEPYLRALFAFIGIEEVEFVRVEGVFTGEEYTANAIADAHSLIARLPLQIAS
jgi:FMN-dependent NADH-azoreductase